MAYLMVVALINYIYYKLISCMPFHYLYKRDPWVFTLVVPALKATVEPLFDIKVSKAKNKDLNGNKEVLGPL
jgi:hypothetical protein